jgi:hypothetical protein
MSGKMRTYGSPSLGLCFSLYEDVWRTDWSSAYSVPQKTKALRGFLLCLWRMHTSATMGLEAVTGRWINRCLQRILIQMSGLAEGYQLPFR